MAPPWDFVHVLVALARRGGLCRRAGLALLLNCFSRLFERRRGRLSSRQSTGEFLVISGGFQDFVLVDFLVDFPVLPRPSTRRLDSVSEDLGSHFLCDGEAGYTLEDFFTNV